MTIPVPWLHTPSEAPRLPHPPTAIRCPKAPARRRRLLRGVLWSLPCAVSIGLSAAELRVIEWAPLPDNRIQLTFRDTGVGALNYVAAFQSSLPSATSFDATSRVVPTGDGTFQVTTSLGASSESSGFFRIAAFLPPDSDGDGLSDALEAKVGTNPQRLDSDGDGFGDGYELAFGGDPLRGDRGPTTPRIEFVASQSSAREGDGSLRIPLKASHPYVGGVRIVVAGASTAVQGEDFVVPTATLSWQGTQGELVIPLVDDLTMEDSESLVLEVEADPQDAYLAGPASRHSVLIGDNDTFWTGVLRREGAEQSFLMRLRQAGPVIEATLVSEFDPDHPERIRGVGTIPHGEWNLQPVAPLSSGTFRADSVFIPMGRSALFGAELGRRLSFEANPTSDTNHIVRTTVIAGIYRDTLTPIQAGLSHLERQVSGGFVLVEIPSALPLPAP